MTISITDLEMTRELDSKAMATTRGGMCKHNNGHYPRNKFGDISRSVVVNDGSSLDNTGGVIVTGDSNEVFSLGADNTLGDKVHFNIHF